jgi:hypothetical protein
MPAAFWYQPVDPTHIFFAPVILYFSCWYVQETDAFTEMGFTSHFMHFWIHYGSGACCQKLSLTGQFVFDHPEITNPRDGTTLLS